MDVDTIFTEKPLFIITKQYDAVKIEDLTEVFAVVYKVELPNYEQVPNEDENTKKSARYLFFTDLEKAFNNYLSNDEFKNIKDDIKKYLQNTLYS